MSLLPTIPSVGASGGGGGGSFPVVIQMDPTRSLVGTTGSSNTANTANTGCLMCLVNIVPFTYTGSIAERFNNIVLKLCEVLKVNLTPFSWNFMQEPFPFCSQCAGMISRLYEFHEKLVEIQKCIDQTVSQVKSTIKSSDSLKTSVGMSSDVRTVIFRAQVLKDLETWTSENSQPNQQETQSNNLIAETGQSQQSPNKYKRKRANIGLVYVPPKTSTTSSQDNPSQVCASTPVSQTKVTPAIAVPALVAVSTLEAINETNSSPEKQALNESVSGSVSDSINIAVENAPKEAEIDLKQLLGAVEVYPTSDCSPTKSAAEIINLNYVAANETVTMEEGEPQRSDTICIEVAPTEVQYDDDFEPYHDDPQNDPDYSESDDNEENKEIKKAVSKIETELCDENDSDYAPKGSKARKRKRSSPTAANVRKMKLSRRSEKQSVKTEPIDFESESPKMEKKTKSHKRERAAKPKSEKKPYSSLIQTDRHGRMFYEGIPVKTVRDNKKAVSCGECGKLFSNALILAGNKKTLILHMRTHHLDEWHDGEKLVRRTRLPPISYASMLETDNQGRVFFKGHEVIGSEGSPGFSCGTCGKSYTVNRTPCVNRKLLINHIQTEHLGEKFNCEHCGASYTNRGSLYDHVRNKHKKGLLECDICGKQMQKKHFDYHRYTHMNEEEKKACIAAGTAPSKVMYRVTPYVCNVCGTIVKGAEALKNHEKSHTAGTTECEFCGKQVNSVRIKQHIQRVHSENPYKGAQCPCCYKFTHDLKNHIKTHTPKAVRQQSQSSSKEVKELPFECSICGFRSETEEQNQNHEANKHKDGPSRFKENYKYACGYCSKRYICRRSHRRHLVKFHPTECAKSRKLRINRSAAGNKKAETEQLESNDDTGVNFSKMGRHLDMDISEGATAKIETNETGEVSFLTVRITKVADGYECGMCGAVARTCFGDETRYIRHHIRAYHLGEFQCDICGKFLQKLSVLTKHKKAHKVSPCPVCQRPSKLKYLHHHLWTHKSQQEKQALIDAGDFNKIPIHVRREMGMPIAKFETECNVCGETIPNKTLLEKHQRAEHPETRKYWNELKYKTRKRKKRVTNEDFTDEDDEFSLSETTETDFSDEEDGISNQKSNAQVSRKRVGSQRSCTNSANHQFPTSSERRSLNPYVSVSRLPAEILSAQRCTMLNDNILNCTFGDGESRQISIDETRLDEESTTYFEIDDSSSEEYTSGDEEDFAVIPECDVFDSE